jgi:hypothetical protein
LMLDWGMRWGAEKIPRRILPRLYTLLPLCEALVHTLFLAAFPARALLMLHTLYTVHVCPPLVQRRLSTLIATCSDNLARASFDSHDGGCRSRLYTADKCLQLNICCVTVVRKSLTEEIGLSLELETMTHWKPAYHCESTAS